MHPDEENFDTEELTEDPDVERQERVDNLLNLASYEHAKSPVDLQAWSKNVLVVIRDIIEHMDELEVRLIALEPKQKEVNNDQADNS